MRISLTLFVFLAACTQSPSSSPSKGPTAPAPAPVKAVSSDAKGAHPAPSKANTGSKTRPETVKPSEAEICADCHPDEVARFAKTGMGRAFYRPASRPPIEDFAPAKATVRHPHMPAVYRAYVDEQGIWWQEETIQEAPEYRRRVQVEYIIGSGNHTRSYLGTVDGELVQLPLTWYSQKGRWDMSPGYDGAGHLRFWRPVKPECLFCHNGLTPYDDRYEAKYTAPIAEGMSCARCHGDSTAHVAARTAGAPATQTKTEIFNPARQSPTRAAEVCQQCHLQGEVQLLAPGQRWDAYDVGTPLSSHHTAFVFPKAATGSEIAGHGTRLSRSKCAQASGDRLRCTTCHDPHGEAVTRPVDTVCAQCHQSTPCADPRGQAKATGCVGCHMQKTGSTDIPHVRITDHYIQRRPSVIAPSPVETTLSPASPLPPGTHLEVARGRALIKAGRLRHPALRTVGVTTLAQALRTSPGTADAWADLGGGYLTLGDHKAAFEAFERALGLEPRRVLIREEHAYAGAGANLVQKAIDSLEVAVGLRPDFAVGLGLLGNLLCQAGRCKDAIPVLAQAERASPTDSTLAFNRGAALLRLRRFEDAMRGFARAMTLDPLNEQAVVEWAQLALAKGDVEGATKAVSRVTKLAPTAPRPRFFLARIRAKAGDLGEAAFQLDRYIALAPKDPNGYVERARVAHRAGDRAGVISFLAKGRAAVPGFPWAEVGARIQAGDSR